MSELQYVWCSDYLIPDLTLNAKDYPPLGKYGRMREQYLREHRHLLYSTMLLGGRLDEHLHEIDDAAQKRVDQLMRQMAETEGITEELKARRNHTFRTSNSSWEPTIRHQDWNTRDVDFDAPIA